MSVKIASLLIVAGIIGITAGVLIYLRAPKEEISEERFGIYTYSYLENNELVISDNDIIWYKKTSHEIKLTEEGVEKVRSVGWAVYGIPFTVKLDNRVIYTGRFWTIVSSVAPSGVIIDTPIENNIIKIDTGFPTPDFVDPRNDNEIFDHFQKIGKLIT